MTPHPPPPPPPWVVLTAAAECAICGTHLNVGERVIRTRGIQRHQGMWIGTCCW